MITHRRQGLTSKIVQYTSTAPHVFVAWCSLISWITLQSTLPYIITSVHKLHNFLTVKNISSLQPMFTECFQEQ
jgi:hypothetical protein